MLHNLQTYLRTTATPELTAAVEEAHELFDELGMENYEPGYEELLMMHGTVDPDQTLMSITELTNQLQRRILQEHDIELIESEIATSTYNSLIRGLLQLQDYEDFATLTTITMLDNSNEEILAEALSLVTEKTPDEWMEYIDSVGMFLIARLRELAYKEKPLDFDALERAEQHLSRLQKFQDLIGNAELTLSKRLKDGLSVGYPFTTYTNPELDALPAEQAAQELVAMALVSKEGLNNPRGIIRSHLEEQISSIDKITKIDIEVNKLLLALERA